MQVLFNQYIQMKRNTIYKCDAYFLCVMLIKILSHRFLATPSTYGKYFTAIKEHYFKYFLAYRNLGALKRNPDFSTTFVLLSLFSLGS